MSDAYRICTRCAMDTSDRYITFDENGWCNHCRDYHEQDRKDRESGLYAEEKLHEFVAAMKEDGKGKPYDCLLGVSGGIDSTYMAYLAHTFGLRPLCLHMDNGWDSELAVKNIELVIRSFGFPLQTYVLDWEEFKDMQLAFLRASVLDIELLTDHAIFAAVYQVAHEHGIRYILSGGNNATESQHLMPLSWNHNKFDIVNIYAIHNQFGTRKIRTFPFLDNYRRQCVYGKLGIQFVTPLEYIPYVVKDVTELLRREIGWRSYGGKHHESVFTRFYQCYIMPRKFGIDKRRSHLSNLVCSGQMTRDEALEILARPPYTPEQLREDKTFVLKKLGLTDAEFEEIMDLPPKSHFDYIAGSLPRY